MKTKLIAETGKCKLKGSDFPVRIYATDGGPNRDQIHGAYKGNNCVWTQITWNKDGTYIHNMESFNLVPIPQSQYFCMLGSLDGSLCASEFTKNLEVITKIEPCAGSFQKLGTYKYTDGEIEKVEES